MLSVQLQVGQKTIIHSNPQDAANNPIVPYGGYSYTANLPNVAVLTSQPDTRDVLVTAGLAGSAIVTIQGQTAPNGPYVTGQFSVTVTPGVLDHFAPTADPPTAA